MMSSFKNDRDGEDNVFCLSDYEDALPYCTAVFDGVGGTGFCRVIVEDNIRTDAYLASNNYCKIVESFVELNSFEEYYIASQKDENRINDAPKEVLDVILSKWVAELQSFVSKEIIKILDSEGYYQKREYKNIDLVLPSTIALAYHVKLPNLNYTFFVWCGDSRCYILSKQGLHQISKDDAEEDLDALEDLLASDSIQMSKCLRVDMLEEPCLLNHASLVFRDDEKFIMICASDGCYGYEETPMHFENVLLYYMLQAVDYEDYIHNLRLYYEKKMYDDTSMGLIPIGFNIGEFSEMKRYYNARLQEITSKYIRPFAQVKKECRVLKNEIETLDLIETIDLKILAQCGKFDHEFSDWLFMEYVNKFLVTKNKGTSLRNKEEDKAFEIEAFLNEIRERIEIREKSEENQLLILIEKKTFICLVFDTTWRFPIFYVNPSNYNTEYVRDGDNRIVTLYTQKLDWKPEYVRDLYNYIMTKGNLPICMYKRDSDFYYLITTEIWKQPLKNNSKASYVCCNQEAYNDILNAMNIAKKNIDSLEVLRQCIDELYGLQCERLKEVFIRLFNDKRKLFDSQSLEKYITAYNKRATLKVKAKENENEKALASLDEKRISLWLVYKNGYEMYLSSPSGKIAEGEG